MNFNLEPEIEQKNNIKKPWNSIAFSLLYFSLFLIVQMAVVVVECIVVFLFFKENDFVSIFNKYSLLLGFVSTMISLTFYFIFKRSRNQIIKEFCLPIKISLSQSIMVFLLGISLNFTITMILNLLPGSLLDGYNAHMSYIPKCFSFWTLLYIGIMAPIFEEIVFRALIFNELKKNINLYISIFIQALIFGIAHFNIVQFLYTFAVGVILAIVYQLLKTIWAPIILHIVFNITYIIIGTLNFDSVPFIVMLVAPILTIGCIILLKRVCCRAHIR